jgi:hypothetical protein
MNSPTSEEVTEKSLAAESAADSEAGDSEEESTKSGPVATFLRGLVGFAALLTSQLEIGAILIPSDRDIRAEL